MHSILKYVLPPGKNAFIDYKDEIQVEMPANARILHAASPDGLTIELWAEVITVHPLEPRLFAVYETGQSIERPARQLKFVSTVMLGHGQLVFHVYEIAPQPGPDGQ